MTCPVRGSLRLPNNTQSPSSNLRTLPVTIQTTTDRLASILSLIHHCTTVVYFLGLNRYQYRVSSNTYFSIGADTCSSFTCLNSQHWLHSIGISGVRAKSLNGLKFALLLEWQVTVAVILEMTDLLRGEVLTDVDQIPNQCFLVKHNSD